MNELSTDISFMSLKKHGEELCGDRVEIVPQGEGSAVVVLADGLGSGVKANILSTLTAKIISTMLAEGMSLEDSVETAAATLPVSPERGGAYSTFTVICIIENREAEIIQYENPQLILLKNGKNREYPFESLEVDGKKMLRTRMPIEAGDTLMAFTDGATHAGMGRLFGFGWERKSIIDYLETMYDESFTAKTLNGILLDECNKLYFGKPGDDTTSVAIRVRERQYVNLMIGPPSSPAILCDMHAAFFGAEGKHIVCGGTTTALAAQYLGTEPEVSLDYPDDDIPPAAKVNGLDLATEGVLTMSRVVEYAKDHLGENIHYSRWGFKSDAASLISRMLFEEATDVRFFVGCAANPAHQNPNLPLSFNIKMQLVESLCDSLKKMGKRVEARYF